jgi:hypothetical protein
MLVTHKGGKTSKVTNPLLLQSICALPLHPLQYRLEASRGPASSRTFNPSCLLIISLHRNQHVEIMKYAIVRYLDKVELLGLEFILVSLYPSQCM